MIAFRDNLPVIILGNGQIVAFEREWLARALGVAASRVGYGKWWLAEHVARSVEVWLGSLAETTLPAGGTWSGRNVTTPLMVSTA